MAAPLLPRKEGFTRPRQPLVWVVGFFALGIGTDRFADFSVLGWLALALMGLVIWCVRVVQQEWRVSVYPLFVLIASAGGTWHHVYWNWYPDDEVSLWAEMDSRPVAIEGILVTEPRQLAAAAQLPLSVVDHDERTLIELELAQIRMGEQWHSCSGRLRAMVKGPVRVRAQERIRALGAMKLPEGTRNPGEFDFRSLSRSRRMLASLFIDSADQIEVVAIDGFRLSHFRNALRAQLDQEIWSKVDQRQAGLASAILLGNREQLSSDERMDFMLTGTVHILAISGLHVGILSGAVFSLFRLLRVPRHVNLVLAIVFVFAYAWLVEFRAPVTRAMLLIICFCFSKLSGRVGFSYNLLALSGMLVLILNPTDLFGLGPQLSFLAVFSMTALGQRKPVELDPVTRLVATTRAWPVQFLSRGMGSFWAGVRLSSLIWLASIPLVAHHFHLFVPGGLLINPFVIIPMAFSLFGGLLVMVFGGWFEPLAIFGGWFCEFNLELIQYFVRWGKRLPGGFFWTAGPSMISVILFYVGLIIVSQQRRVTAHRFWFLSLFTFWMGVGWLGPAAWQTYLSRSNQTYCTATVIDVGHGSSTLVSLPNGEQLLVDAGAFGSMEAGLRSISGVLWSEGIHRLDAVILSHADVDHFNAIPELAKRFSIGVVYLPLHMFDTAEPSVVYLREELERQKIPLRPIWRGVEFQVGVDAEMTVLGPPYYAAEGSDNSKSVVIQISAFDRTLILPGDIEPPGLNELFALQGIDADVVTAPHHGSMGSHPDEFAQWCRPDLVLVSGARSRVRPEALELYEQFGCQVVSTGTAGAIRIRLSREGVQWQSWIEHNRQSGTKRFSNFWQPVKGEFVGAQ